MNEYKIVAQRSALGENNSYLKAIRSFEGKVQEEVKQGWQLQGSMRLEIHQAAPAGKPILYLAQPMIQVPVEYILE
jgi:hypothetical protein